MRIAHAHAVFCVCPRLIRSLTPLAADSTRIKLKDRYAGQRAPSSIAMATAEDVHGAGNRLADEESP